MAQTLKDLKAKADQLERDFEAVITKHGFSDVWAFLRADRDNPSSVPAECLAANDAHIAALHAFYEARDGSKGFLGGKGL